MSILAGRHAVVTGGGRGIGAAIASALAAAGARLTLMGRTPGPLQEKAAALPQAQAIACDVTDEPAVAAAFAQASEAFGPVAILINNAGAAASAPLARTSLALLREMLDVNLVSAFLCSRAVLPDMLAARLRPHRQRRERRRPEGRALHHRLRRRQAWRGRPDPRARDGDRKQGHHGQCRLPELYRY